MLLQQNKVTFSFSPYITHSLLHIDTHHTEPQCNKIGDQGAQHLANALQQNKVTFSFSLHITHSLLHIDTHHTEPQ